MKPGSYRENQSQTSDVQENRFGNSAIEIGQHTYAHGEQLKGGGAFA
jgi:hypothetical protein